MVASTPEVVELARRLRLKPADVVAVLDVFQHCDPYLNRRDVIISPLLLPCQQVWQRYADDSQLAAKADELGEYFK